VNVSLTGLLLTVACLALPAWWNGGRWPQVTGEVKAYPNARTEPWFENYQKEARDSIRKSNDAELQMWMTDDSFDQVVSHYRAMGVERPEFAQSLAKMLSGRSGREVKATYVIFDGAEGPVLSKHYVSIQRPVVVQYEPLEVHDVTVIGLFRSKK
jgi:hypothetical protein